MAGHKINVAEWEQKVRHCPAKVIDQLCDNWTYKLRNDVASEWGFPIIGETIDLMAVLKWLREFLKQQGPLLRVLKEDGEEGPLGVQYLRAKIAKTEADAAGKVTLNAKKEGMLCDRETLHSAFEIIASQIIKAGSVAQKKWGSDGLEFFSELLERIEAAVRGLINADGAANEIEGLETDGDDPRDAAL